MIKSRTCVVPFRGAELGVGNLVQADCGLSRKIVAQPFVTLQKQYKTLKSEMKKILAPQAVLSVPHGWRIF